MDGSLGVEPRPVRKGGLAGYEDPPPPNSQKYTKKVHTVCILKLSKMQGSFTITTLFNIRPYYVGLQFTSLELMY